MVGKLITVCVIVALEEINEIAHIEQGAYVLSQLYVY